jgi:hypothetical protein
VPSPDRAIGVADGLLLRLQLRLVGLAALLVGQHKKPPAWEGTQAGVSTRCSTDTLLGGYLMSKNSIPQTFAQRQRVAFAAMVPDMVVGATSKPRRYMGHPSNWRFFVERGCFEPIMSATAPSYALSAACHLVEEPRRRTLPQFE